ncbi:MAG: ABC transporter ATP-binding protein/permease [Saprospiraceae bacterium]|nr:ABC transporter ATP-binding protein/permease [Saprospiraceae bacterium]
MSTFWKLFRNLKDYRPQVAGNIIGNILVALFTVVSIPAIIPFFEILFDRVVPVVEKPAFGLSTDQLSDWATYQYSNLIAVHDKQTALLYICGFIVLVFFLKNFFRYLSLAMLVPVRNGIVRDLRKQLYRKVLDLPMGYYSRERKGDIIARFSTDVQEVEHSILNVIEVVVKSPLIIIGCIAFMYIVSPSLTLFVFVLLFFTIVVIGSISRTLKKKSSQAQSKLAEIISTIDETVTGLKMVKSFNAQPFFQSQFDRQNDEFRSLINRILWRRDLSSPVSEFLGIIVVSVLLWYGSNLVFENQLQPGTFFAFIFAFFNVIEPSKSFSKAYYDIQKGLAAAERIDNVLEEDLIVQEPSQPKQLPQGSLGIAFKQVSFRYSEHEQTVLQDIDLDIPAGKVVAIVGASGSGKTTLIDLLNRFYDVTSGSISIGGVDIRDVMLSDLREKISIVSQEPFAFNDSIKNNILFGMQDVTEDAVVSAARTANAHSFISQCEHGYDTVIGDRGVKLSGGQRQRLTIARAVLKDSPILVLDEATSALDSESEKQVQDAIAALIEGRTVIIIAHRLSTIQHADLIFVLKDGRIIETGQHGDLMSIDGEYKKFVELQAF